MTFIQPGPNRVRHDQNPGGVVIHIYAVPSGELLHVSIASDVDDIDQRAAWDQGAAARNLPPGSDGFCLVAYDGDTGRRFTPEEWLA